MLSAPVSWKCSKDIARIGDCSANKLIECACDRLMSWNFINVENIHVWVAELYCTTCVAYKTFDIQGERKLARCRDSRDSSLKLTSPTARLQTALYTNYMQEIWGRNTPRVWFILSKCRFERILYFASNKHCMLFRKHDWKNMHVRICRIYFPR